MVLNAKRLLPVQVQEEGRRIKTKCSKNASPVLLDRSFFFSFFLILFAENINKETSNKQLSTSTFFFEAGVERNRAETNTGRGERVTT